VLSSFGLLTEFDERDGVFELVIEPCERAEPILEVGALAHHLLGGVGIVPEVGVFDLGVQLGQAARRGVDVKDASSAIPWTA
jgi:hypothetical protein